MKKESIFSAYKGLPREIYILSIGRMVNSIGAFIHPLMTLILTQKIGMSTKGAGMYVTLLAVCQVPCLILGGKLSDTIGRKKMIVVFQSLGAMILMACAFVKPSQLMATMMIVSSCLYSLSSPSYDALNADLTTSSNRKASYSLLYMGSNLGFAIGPIIAGMLYENHLPIIFIGDAITTLISLSLVTLFIKETITKKESSDCEDEDIDNLELNLERHTDESTFRVLMKRPYLIVFSLMMLTYLFGYSQFGFALPIQLSEIFKSSGGKLYGMISGFNGILVIVLTPIITLTTKKLKPLKSIAIGGVLYFISFALFGVSNKIFLFFFGMFLLTTGEVFISINQGAFIANNTPASHRGRISSILPLIYGAGYAIGPMIMGGVIHNYGITKSWMFVSIIVLIGAIGMYNLEIKNRKMYN